MRLIYIFITILFCYVIYTTLHRSYNSGAPFTIVCTTTILADAIRSIVGEHAQVISLMGPGVDPHLYRAREGDLHKLAHAQLIFYNGLHLEGKLATLLGSLDRYAPAYAVSDTLEPSVLRAVENGLYDPHIWFSVPLWIEVVSYIAQRCAEHDHEYASAYYDNADYYIHTLLLLHQWIQKQISSLPAERRILVTAHDAFGYFGQAYGIEVVALQGISTEADIGAWDVSNLVQFMVAKKIPALFVETAIPHRTLQAVVDAVQAQGMRVTLGAELYTDALGDAALGADTYVKMVEHNVRAIVSGLGSPIGSLCCTT